MFFTVLYYVELALWFANLLFSGMRWFHMFQLNSYKPKTQLRWMKTHRGKLAALCPALLAAICAWIGGKVASCILFVLLLWSLYVLRPKKAKKPLVYTSRVKRMFAAFLLLNICVSVSSWFLGGRFALALPLTVLTLSPLTVLLANAVCAPIEKAVRNRYTNQAIRMLRDCPDLLVVGVTGSYGKTSVKSYLGQLLSTAHDTLITPESFNTPMGVVRTVREHLRPTHEIFICEMGARQVGDIKELCDMVHPKHGILTAVGNQHLETFKTQDNIRNTKYELADALPEGGFLLCNGDCTAMRNAPPKHPHLWYGLSKENDYFATDITVTTAGTEFTLHTPSGETCVYRTKLIGNHSVQNIVGALAFCDLLGLPLHSLVGAVRKLNGVPHRMQLLPGGDGVTFLDDAYNSNPAGCAAALETLGRFTDALHILVTPGMVELGDAMEECNQAFGAQAAKVCDYCILVGEKQAPPIKRGLLSEGFDEAKILTVHTVQEGIAAARAFKSGEKKIVLLENDLTDNY